jgi:hypothetical protein
MQPARSLMGFAEPVIGRRFAPTRWLSPSYQPNRQPRLIERERLIREIQRHIDAALVERPGVKLVAPRAR